mmetsp:Transcript_27540/g.72404  ORF Transcript_27540/g.72404 Transcript_27540/m.72404 type:complete len:205 (-) Transcript_27540:679-1293(-)
MPVLLTGHIKKTKEVRKGTYVPGWALTGFLRGIRDVMSAVTLGSPLALACELRTSLTRCRTGSVAGRGAESAVRLTMCRSSPVDSGMVLGSSSENGAAEDRDWTVCQVSFRICNACSVCSLAVGRTTLSAESAPVGASTAAASPSGPAVSRGCSSRRSVTATPSPPFKVPTFTAPPSCAADLVGIAESDVLNSSSLGSYVERPS